MTRGAVREFMVCLCPNQPRELKNDEDTRFRLTFLELLGVAASPLGCIVFFCPAFAGSAVVVWRNRAIISGGEVMGDLPAPLIALLTVYCNTPLALQMKSYLKAAKHVHRRIMFERGSF